MDLRSAAIWICVASVPPSIAVAFAMGVHSEEEDWGAPAGATEEEVWGPLCAKQLHRVNIIYLYYRKKS